MTHEQIAAAVDRLAAQFPHLVVDGLCRDYNTKNPAAGRDAVLADVIRWPEMVQQCVDWLEQCSKTKGFNRRTDTYGFKHEVEQHVGNWVSHTALLVASQVLEMDLEHSKDRPWAGALRIGRKRPS